MNRYACFLCLSQLGTSIFAHNQVAEVFTHTGSNCSAQAQDCLFSGRARHTAEASGEQEGLTSEWAFDRLLLLLHIQPGLSQSFDQGAVLFVLEPAIDALSNNRPDAGDATDFGFACIHQAIPRGEM